MYTIDNLTVNAYLEKLAAPSFPGPASGSAAAIAAAMAAALLEMSYEVTINKDEQKRYLIEPLKKVTVIRTECLILATKDMQAYAEVVKAIKIKKQFPDAFEMAMKNATDTLVSIIKNCSLILTHIEQVVEISYRKVLGDLGGSAYLAEAAAAAAKQGAEVNLKLLQDQNLKRDVINTISVSYKDCSKTKDRIVEFMAALS